MDGMAIKSERLLIPSWLAETSFRKKNWRSGSVSRSEAFNVTWNHCAVFLRSKGCDRTSSMIGKRRVTVWNSPLFRC